MSNVLDAQRLQLLQLANLPLFLLKAFDATASPLFDPLPLSSATPGRELAALSGFGAVLGRTVGTIKEMALVAYVLEIYFVHRVRQPAFHPHQCPTFFRADHAPPRARLSAVLQDPARDRACL